MIPGVPPVLPAVKWTSRFYSAEVNAAANRLKFGGLKKAGFAVMKIARRSILKMGAAKPKLAVAKQNPGLTLREISQLPRAGGVFADGISERNRARVLERIREIKARKPSAPGTPPHTHNGFLRRNVFFDLDRTGESVVIGAFMPRAKWLSVLHEFGGASPVTGWMYVPKRAGNYKPIVSYFRNGESPKNTERWRKTRAQKTLRYPARPYLAPAVGKAIAAGKIAAEFKNRFRAGGG